LNNGVVLRLLVRMRFSMNEFSAAELFYVEPGDKIRYGLVSLGEPGYLSGMALGCGLHDRWFERRQNLGIFLFTTASRSSLGPTQFPIQWDLSLGTVRWEGVDWMHLAQDRDQLWALVNTVLNFSVP
jgi:hypothetical protein